MHRGHTHHRACSCNVPFQRQREKAARCLAGIWSHQPFWFMFVTFGVSSFLFRGEGGEGGGVGEDQILMPKAAVYCTMALWPWIFASKWYFNERCKQRKHQSERVGTKRVPKENGKKRAFCYRINPFLFLRSRPQSHDGARGARGSARLPEMGTKLSRSASAPRQLAACRRAACPYPSQRICRAIKLDNPSGLWYISGHDYFITRSISVGS